MKYRNFSPEIEGELADLRSYVQHRTRTRQEIEAAIKREWSHRSEVIDLGIADKVAKLVARNKNNEIPLTVIQDAAKLKNYDKWKEFLEKWGIK